MQFSDLSQNLTGQPMFAILKAAKEKEAKGQDMVHFELGDPDFETPHQACNAAIKAIINGNTHYTSSSGELELLEEAQKVTLKSRGFSPDISQMLVTCGANMQIYLSLACTCNKGDKVILPVPYFPTYMSTIQMLGLEPIFFPLRESNNFRPDFSDIEQFIDKRTKAIIVNSPSNPTGGVMTQPDMVEAFGLAQRHDLLLISDEVYSRTIFDDNFYSPSTFDHCRERVLVVNGFSKSFAMTGWRLGVATGPQKLIATMQFILETIISCVPPFIQMAGVAALKYAQDYSFEMSNEFKKRRDIMVQGLNDIEGISCVRPNGAIYCFANIKDTKYSDYELSDILLNGGVVVCPGSIFGQSGFIRLCLAKSEEHIIEGMRRIVVAIEGKLM